MRRKLDLIDLAVIGGLWALLVWSLLPRSW